MARALIENVSSGPLTLPAPYGFIIPVGRGAVVGDAAETAITYLGGVDAIIGVARVSTVGDNAAIHTVPSVPGAVASLSVTGAVAAGSFTGPLTGDTTGQHTGDVVVTDGAQGLKLGAVTVQAPLPLTLAQAQEASGMTNVAFLRFDRLNIGSAASLGNVAVTLAPSGVPAYQAHSSGRHGVHTPTSVGDALSVAVASGDPIDVAALSFLAVIVGSLLTDPNVPPGATHTLYGQISGGARGWMLYVEDDGDLAYQFSDGTHTFTAVLAAGFMPVGGPPGYVIVQLDRSGTDPVARFRWGRDGVNVGSANVPMVALGTLWVASQEAGIGAFPVATPAANGGAWVQYVLQAKGVQAEGATKAQLAAQGHGME